MSRLAYVMIAFPTLTETFILREIEALQAAGVEVELFSLSRPAAAHAKAEGEELARRTFYSPGPRSRALWPVNARVLKRSPGRYLRTLGAVFARTALNPVHCAKSLCLFAMAVDFAERMRERGVTHVHGHWATYSATVAYVISRLLGIPYSFTAHAYDATLIRSMMREKIRRAEFVLTCTGWNQRILGRMVPEARSKIFLNHHGAVLDRFVPDRPARPAAPERFTILSCGSLYPRKGFPYLIEACRILRERGRAFECVIVGEGPMRGELQRLIDRHRLRDCVRLTGALSQRDVIQAYREADLFALACITDRLGWQEIFTDPVRLMEVGLAIPFRTLTDGIPNVLVEAMAMEIPVVSTYVAGVPELIEDGRTGLLVAEKDPRALAAALERLMREPETGRAMAVRGRAVVQERFDRHQNIKQLVEIFAEYGGGQRTRQRELRDASTR